MVQARHHGFPPVDVMDKSILGGYPVVAARLAEPGDKQLISKKAKAIQMVFILSRPARLRTPVNTLRDHARATHLKAQNLIRSRRDHIDLILPDTERVQIGSMGDLI